MSENIVSKESRIENEQAVITTTTEQKLTKDDLQSQKRQIASRKESLIARNKELRTNFNNLVEEEAYVDSLIQQLESLQPTTEETVTELDTTADTTNSDTTA